MSTQEFNRLGEELFGEGWRGALALLLRIDKRAVQRWANGQNAVPAEVIDSLHAILATVEQLQAIRASQESRPWAR